MTNTLFNVKEMRQEVLKKGCIFSAIVLSISFYQAVFDNILGLFKLIFEGFVFVLASISSVEVFLTNYSESLALSIICLIAYGAYRIIGHCIECAEMLSLEEPPSKEKLDQLTLKYVNIYNFWSMLFKVFYVASMVLISSFFYKCIVINSALSIDGKATFLFFACFAAAIIVLLTPLLNILLPRKLITYIREESRTFDILAKIDAVPFQEEILDFSTYKGAYHYLVYEKYINSEGVGFKDYLKSFSKRTNFIGCWY